jgi:hypothetical protein
MKVYIHLYLHRVVGKKSHKNDVVGSTDTEVGGGGKASVSERTSEVY